MISGENRTFLFLQGPHGPFFQRLGKMLRAAGADVWRVGFNAFEVRDDRDIQEALSGLKDYTVTYQGDVHDPRPIYRRA